jgi:hypothetical protein
MLQKIPKGQKGKSNSSWLRFGAKLTAFGVAAELACLGASYLFWRKLNNEQGYPIFIFRLHI